MHSKNGGYLIAMVIVILAIAGLVIFLTTAKAGSSEISPDDIKAVLSDYSRYIETEKTSRKANYSNQMDQLVSDRQAYYQEFFNKGLHSDLISMESQYMTEKGVTITQREDTYSICIAEKVTLHGKPITTSPDEYPLIQAARWALDQTSDAGIKSRLKQYIASMTEGVEESVHDGVLIEFSVIHDMEISIEKGKAKILKDTFSDKSSDNREGFDNVNWIGNQFSRQVPDWRKMPDNEMYHVPVEIIGKRLLADFTEIATKSMAQSSGYFTNREHAVWYIREYTSNPDYYHYIYCGPDNPSVLQNTVYYNPEYSSIWSVIGCNDCADFVSQALHNGGYPLDDYWEPDIYNEYWVRPFKLGEYFDTIIDRGSFVDNLSSLQIGDIAFIYKHEFVDPNLNWMHSVMISKINPHRYSGHTNDRLDYAFNPDFNRFLAIMYDPFVYIPLIIKNDKSYYALEGRYDQMPYPAPVEHQDPSLLPIYPAPIEYQNQSLLQPYPAP